MKHVGRAGQGQSGAGALRRSLLQPLGAAIASFWDGTFGSTFAIGASVNRAVTPTLVGLGFILANRANLTNVGGEGQLAVGGIASTAIALHRAERLPLVAALAPLAGVALAGALWGDVAGALKVRRGTNEVISTLLLTFIGLLLVYAASPSADTRPTTASRSVPRRSATGGRLPVS